MPPASLKAHSKPVSGGILTVVKKALTHTYYCGNLNYKSI